MSEDYVKLTRSEISAMNKQAFDDVFGDPFAKPEPIPGNYQTFKGRGVIAAMKNNFDEGKGTRNPATPNLIDFFCDVDRVLTDNLSPDEYTKFVETYIFESEAKGFNQKERSLIEQRLGKLFRARKLSPVNRYFKTIRGKQKNDPSSNRSKRGASIGK